MPVKPTIKEVGPDGLVLRTLKRELLWEVQTPQVGAQGALPQADCYYRMTGTAA